MDKTQLSANDRSTLVLNRFSIPRTKPKKRILTTESRLLNSQARPGGNRVELTLFHDGRIAIGFAPLELHAQLESNIGKVIFLSYEEGYERHVPVLHIVDALSMTAATDPLRTPMPAWLTRETAEHYTALCNLVERLDEPHRELVREVFRDDELLCAYLDRPASLKYHHNQSGGLFAHSVQVALDCEQACCTHKAVNRSLAIAAALLHDIGKTWEYAKDGLGSYYRTQTGDLLLHKLLGVEIICLAAYRCKVDREIKDQIVHCVSATRGSDYSGLPTAKLPEHRIVQTADSRSAGLDTFELPGNLVSNFTSSNGTSSPTAEEQAEPTKPRWH